MEVQQKWKLSPDLEQKLSRLECPFNWVKAFTADDLTTTLQYDFHDKVREKLNTSNDDDFIEYGFPSGVCLIYEYTARREDRGAVKEVIDICEANLNSVFENRSNHSLIRKARPAFVHVLQGCKAFFERHYGDIKSFQDVLSNIPNHNEFNKDIQACVYGIKAAFLLTFGPYKTTEVGVQCAKKAIELDSTEGWYYFLAGKGLYRHRRAVNKGRLPSDKEIDFMQRARQMGYKLEESAMFLIEMYSEMIQRGKCTEISINIIAQLCRSIYEITEDWYCLWRCSRGLIRIKNLDQQCLDLVQQCLEKADKLSPKNPEIMLVFSHFYEWKKHDLINAQHYCQLAVHCGRSSPMYVSSLTRLMYLNDCSKDLTPVFDDIIGKSETAFNKHVSMCLKARYLLQEQQHNLKGVLQIFAQILQEDTKCLQQQEPEKKQLSTLLSILFYDIQDALRKPPPHNKVERNYCESELQKIKQTYLRLKNISRPQIRQNKWWNTYYDVRN